MTEPLHESQPDEIRGSAPTERIEGLALSGRVAAISLFDIMQMLVLGRHTGKLTVQRDKQRGDF